MLSMLVVAAVAMQSGSTLWVTAEALAKGSLTAPTEGHYGVWAWTPRDFEGDLQIGGETLSIDSGHPKDSKDYFWLKIGDADLQAGEVKAVAPEEIAKIALSTAEGFDPQRAATDRHVYDLPRGVEDRRAKTAKGTNTVFTMPHFESVEAWEAFKEPLRRRVLLSSGLWPLPEKTPLNAQIFGRIEHPEYTVEKVHFEAYPGFLVTGNLYRPVGEGPFPAVVNPHGHWEIGRLANEERGSVPGRAITLARMGMVAFTYDMIGYVDSLQCDHRGQDDRTKLWGLHPFALQLWSSVRAVDFVESLPEVDRDRIGCTGASGGGTQTFALMAIEPRIKVAAPVNMISSTMQGGCICENAPILRLDNSNMEIGATMAPRPLLMVSATGDWTRETPRVEYPAIRSVFALYGAEDKVKNVHIDAGHNYNQASREAMYRFFGKWLKGEEGWDDYTEPPFEVEPEEDLRVFPDKELPAGLKTQDEIYESIIKSRAEKWEAVFPRDDSGLAAFAKAHGTVLSDVLGTELPGANDLALERTGMEERDGYVLERWIIGRKTAGDAIPAVFYRSRTPGPQDAVLLVHGQGKAALADAETGGPGKLIRGLIDRGKAVLSIDAFLLGDHHSPFKRTERYVEGGFMDTFQPTDTGYRAQDVLTAAAFLRARRDLTGAIELAGIEDGGVWALLAAAIDPGITKTVADINYFDPNDDAAWVERFYVPCIRAVGDLSTAVALVAARGQGSSTPVLTLVNTKHTGELFSGITSVAVPDAAGLSEAILSAL